MAPRGLEISFAVLAVALALAGYRSAAEEAGSFRLPPRDGHGLRVLTWNLGGSGEGVGRPLDEKHLGHVVRVLKEVDADLVLLQELQSAAQARRLRQWLGDDWQLLIGGRSRRRLAVAAQRGPVRPWSLPPDPSAMGVRYLPPAQPAVAIVNLHAHAFSAGRRNALLGRMVQALDRARAARILGGDLNLDIDVNRRRDLFTDNEHLDLETYNYVAGRLRDAALGGGATAEPDRRLDYLFVDPIRFRVTAAGPLKGQRIGDMDHDPVVADLRFADQ
jgi:endonuclease/exonuclease/phosphatase family metal-dependent hydrolase